jgi:hypothetical protein
MPISNLAIEKGYTYAKAIKNLKKRFRNIEDDVDKFLDSVSDIDQLGVNLGDNIFKARIANSNKNSRKSSGYRLIAYLKLVDKKLILVYIYDKSDFENVSEGEIDKLIMQDEESIF